MVKILFVDVDGTLTETLSGATFKQHPQDVKVMEGAREAVAHFARKGWRIIGVSNQGGVGTGHKTLEEAIAEMRFTLSLFPDLIESIYFCPDMAGEDCIYVNIAEAFEVGTIEPELIGTYRKPAPGMIWHILEGFEDEGIEIDETWMVGDRKEDEDCAANAKINFCPANMWRDRFRKGTFAYAATPEQIKFLEGIGVTATGG